eukprot:gene18882-22560_t
MEELRRQLAQKTDEVQQGRQQLLELKQFLKLTDRQLELKRQARAWRVRTHLKSDPTTTLRAPF